MMMNHHSQKVMRFEIFWPFKLGRSELCSQRIIGVRSTLIPNPRLERLRGAERFLVPQYEEAPLSLSNLGLTKLMLI